jgi:hypothetical protein
MFRSETTHLLNQARFSTQVSRRVYDALGKWPGIKLDGDFAFDSTDVVNRALKKAAPLDIRVYDCCETGCLAYTGPYENWDENQACGVCKKARKRNVSKLSTC